MAGAVGAWTISVQIYSAAETPIGAPFNVVQGVPTVDSQIAGLDGGRFVVTWTNGSNFLARIYDATGTAVTTWRPADAVSKAVTTCAPRLLISTASFG